jgi:hypothetical protein
MRVKQQKGNSNVPLSTEEEFWPFDGWDGPGKETASLGDESGYSSIKNYPSFTGKPVEEHELEIHSGS